MGMAAVLVARLVDSISLVKDQIVIMCEETSPSLSSSSIPYFTHTSVLCYMISSIPPAALHTSHVVLRMFEQVHAPRTKHRDNDSSPYARYTSVTLYRVTSPNFSFFGPEIQSLNKLCRIFAGHSFQPIKEIECSTAEDCTCTSATSWHAQQRLRTNVHTIVTVCQICDLVDATQGVFNTLLLARM